MNFKLFFIVLQKYIKLVYSCIFQYFFVKFVQYLNALTVYINIKIITISNPQNSIQIPPPFHWQLISLSLQCLLGNKFGKMISWFVYIINKFLNLFHILPHKNSDSSATINNCCRISRNVNCLLRNCENSFIFAY